MVEGQVEEKCQIKDARTNLGYTYFQHLENS